MKKKVVAILMVFVMMIATFSNTYAVELFNLGIYETAYKLSKENDINLPFINLFEKSASYDKPVKHSGITFGESIIDVEDKLEGVHVFFTEDMLTIKGEIEHGVLFAKNVVVEGKISEDTIILAETVKILETAVIERDVVIVTTTLEHLGTVKGNLIAVTEDAKISGIVEKDLRISTATLNLEESDIKGKIEAELGVTTEEKITTLYPEAVITKPVENVDKINIKSVIVKGIKTVLVYTFVAMLITTKTRHVSKRATARFMENSSFGILSSAALLALFPVIAVVLLVVALFGLGIIVWPILIVYLAIVLLALAVCQLIVGLLIYELLKKKEEKYKLPILTGIFTTLYASTQIPMVSSYVVAALAIVSLAVILTYIFKKEETSEFVVAEEKVINIKEEVKEETEQPEVKKETKTNSNKNKSKKKNKKK